MSASPADVRALFDRAAELATPEERAAFLDRACDGDPDARERVEALLRAIDEAGSFLGRPVEAPTITAAPPPPADRPGMVVGPYRLLEKIGEGGMGEVWVADQAEPIRRRVALKLIKPGMDSRAVLARFEAERQALALMDHPNIARVLDAGTTPDGRPYFAMELVKGTPITEFSDARHLSPRERLELFVPVCQAIQHAHQKGIIHRDIKPSNVLVELHDDRAVVKVIDFGVAKAVGQRLTEKTLYTGFGALVGTPAYMAPEQATFNALDVDTRADVYALGVLLYELLAGSPPIDQDRLKRAAIDEILRIVRDEEPPRPSVRLSTSEARATIASVRQTDPAKLSALIRGELDWIVMKCLEKDRTRRYDGAAALAKDVRRYLAGDAVDACPPTMAYRLRKTFRRHRAAILVGGLVAASLLGATVVSLVSGVRARRSEAFARSNEEKALRAESAANDQRQQTEQANARLLRTTDLQRKTRYAAEMNLVQAAHNARDMEQARTLLANQIPKAGEPDDRGPEWHYWMRRLNGFAAEHVLALAPEAVNSVTFSPSLSLALSPDGDRLADVNFTPSPNEFGGDGPARRVVIRSDVVTVSSWDLDTGALEARHTWNLPETLQLTPEELRFSTRNIAVQFVRDGREILIFGRFYGPPARNREAGLADLTAPRDYLSWGILWNPRTDESRRLYRETITGPVATTGDHFYSDDLALVLSTRPDPESNGGVILRVARVDDGAEVLRVPLQGNRRLMTPTFTPGGRYLIADLVVGRGVGGFTDGAPGQSSRTLTAWALDGSGHAVLERDTTPPARERGQGIPTGTFLAGNLYQAQQDIPLPDGHSFLHVAFRDAATADVEQIDLDTGESVREQVTFDRPATEVTRIVNSPLGKGLAYDPTLRRLALATATGVSIRPLRTGPGSQARPDDEVEMLDGRPMMITFRPDGRLVSVHYQVPARLLARTWETLRTRRQLFPASLALCDEGRTRLAFSPGGNMLSPRVAYQQVQAGLRDQLFQPLFVIDSRGRRLLDVPVTPGEAPYTLPQAGAFNSGAVLAARHHFSRDGRYFLYPLLHLPEGADLKAAEIAARSSQELVIRDLDAARDVARIRLDAPMADGGLAFHDDDTRFAVPERIPGRDDQVETGYGASFFTRAVLYEFPSGRPAGALKVPEGSRARALRFEDGRWTAILQPAGDPNAVDTEHCEWDGVTGALLARSPRPATDRVGRDPNPAVSPTQTRGERTVRIRWKAPATLGNTGQVVVEIGDRSRTGPDAEPLFTIPLAVRPGRIANSTQADLSPDGRRLLIVSRDPFTLQRGMADASAPRVTLYGTDTGRPLLTIRGQRGVQFGNNPASQTLNFAGFWSADGQHYWHSLTADGQLVGFDFRP